MLMSLQQQTSCCKHNLLWTRRVDVQPRGSRLFGGGAKIMAVMTYKILAGTSEEGAYNSHNEHDIYLQAQLAYAYRRIALASLHA